MIYIHNCMCCRICLSKDEYRVIKPPPGIGIHSENLVLGKSEKGPYLAAQSLYYADPCLRVWILDESNHERGEWVLTHCNKHLGTMLPRCYLDNTVFNLALGSLKTSTIINISWCMLIVIWARASLKVRPPQHP